MIDDAAGGVNLWFRDAAKDDEVFQRSQSDRPMFHGAWRAGMQPLPFCVYVLLSMKDGRLYIGYTTNLDQRLSAHAGGDVVSTKHRRPFRLVFCEFHGSEIDARRREAYFKTDRGKRALRLTLPDGLNLLSVLTSSGDTP